MMSIGLVLTYGFIFAGLRKFSRNKNILESLVLSFLFLNMIILVSTTIFSIPHALNAMNIKWTWIMAALLSGTAWLLLPKRKEKIRIGFPLSRE